MKLTGLPASGLFYLMVLQYNYYTENGTNM